MHRRFLHGNREVSKLTSRGRARGINGKVMNRKPMKRSVEKSDTPIVPVKRANNADLSSGALAKEEQSATECVEGSGVKERNADLQSTLRTQSRVGVSQAQERIREAITRNEQEQLTALLHHVTVDGLRAAFFGLKRDAAPGVDRVTWKEYADGLEERLADLHGRVHRGAYRALPSRRKFIPKPDGRLRPLGIAALEDKIVQSAMVAILTPVYEAEFLGFSYGFRPGRSQHNALDALAFGIARRKVRWVLDADIQSFFDRISHEWLVKFVEHRIGDKRVIRLIRKWLKAGVLEDGIEIETTQGTPQGAVISPLLANIYLHYVYDLWAQQWRKRQSNGDMIVVRCRRHHRRVRAP
jgi:RNA-directed DNA polymerase